MANSKTAGTNILIPRCARCSGESELANSEYHRKQAEILAGLALTAHDDTKAAQLSLMAMEHKALADKLQASESLPRPPRARDDNLDRS
jgi:hypothetical protein